MLYTGEQAHEVVGVILESVTTDKNGNSSYPAHEGDQGYYKEGGKWVAFDNSTCDCWVEEFKTRKAAIAWLNN